MIVTMQDYTITDRAPVLIGYEGENLSRNFTVKTFDDLFGIASIELLIGDVNCGAMTVNTDDTEITISLDAFMIGRTGYKKAQLIMLDDTGAVVMKSNQFDVLVGASNNPRYFASGEKVKTLTVNIDGRTRQIILPAGFAVSVNGDVAVDHIAFKAPASYGEFDFSAAACRVDWTGVDGTSHTNICTEKDADGNWIWALPTALTRGGEGEIAFSVSYVVTDNVGAVTADWNTGLVKFYHLESAKSDDAEEDVEEETTYDRLASAIAAVQAAQASVDDVNAILAGITSATPTVVETVADLNGLDTSKVKLAIVAADGYLYYYNGTAWVSGFAYGGLQEIIAARTDSDGVTHADLKTRLNTAEAQIKEDLSAKLGLNYSNATRISATEESPADLNDYQTVGNYNVINSSNASHIANIPYVSGGYLVVMSQAPNARVQVFIPNIQRTHIYIRAYSSSTWGEWIDIAPTVDTTPTKNSNNLVLSGGVYDAILDATRGGYASESIWEQGVFNSTQGETDAIHRIRTNWFDAGAITYATALEGYEVYAYRMSESGEIRAWNGTTWQQNSGAWVTSVDLSSMRAYKTRFLARNANAPTSIIKPSEGVNIVLTGKLADVNRNALDILADKTLIPNSYGLANVLAKFNRMLNIEWTPVADIPAVGSQGVFKAGVTYKGMLYSSTRLIGKVVGLDVSFKTFLTAMKNPRSVLYTKRATYNLGKAYYGSTCASCIDYAMGWGTNYVGAGIMAKPEVSRQNYINLQSGDILYSKSEGHLIMVHDVFKDEYGRPKYVLYDEAFMPRARQIMQKYQDFVNYRTEKGYIVLRNNAIGDTEYPAEPYVKGYPDETPISVPDYDIMCNYGDEAVLLEGTNVTINILNTDGYTSIEVYKDDNLIQTVTTVADFTLSNLAYGEYRVALIGDGKESSTSFVIVQATCSWDANTHILTFSSANATPRVVWLNDNGTSAFNMYDVDVTTEDIANGYIDLSDAFTEHPDAVNVRLDFKYNGYTASWFSYFNPAWVVDV